MAELRLRHRARMRDKDVKRLADEITAAFGIADPLPEGVERADAGDFDVILHGGRAIAFIQREPERAVPTCRLLQQKKPSKAFVTVDMGAVKFVNNGADIMAPGITQADQDLQENDLCWIRDERNGVPLAVGSCIVPGKEMPRGKKGKAVKSLHHVGDELWNLEV